MSSLLQVPFGSIKGDYRGSALLGLVPAKLSERVSVEWTSFFDDGLGEAVGSVLRASNGDYFALEHHFCAPDARQATSILTLFQSPHESETLDCALCDLSLTTADLTWVREDIRFTACDLIRQDDNGNQFTVGTYPSRADALAEQRKLTASFHKQEYWIQVATRSAK